MYRVLFLFLSLATSVFGMERSDRADEFPKKLTIFHENFKNLSGSISLFQFVQDRQIGKVHKKTASELKAKLTLENFKKQGEVSLTNERISLVAFCPDGNTIATVSNLPPVSERASIIQLWDCRGSSIGSISLEHRIGSMAFHPTGTKIITASFGKETLVCDLEGKVLQRLSHDHMIKASVFDPSGNIIMSVSVPRVSDIELWNLEGEKQACFKPRSEMLRSTVFSPDGKTIMTLTAVRGTGESIITKWNLRGEIMTELRLEKSFLKSALLSPDGTKILANRFCTIKLLDFGGSELACVKRPSRILLGTIDAQFHPDGNMIVAYSSHGSHVVFFNLKGDQLATLGFIRGQIIDSLACSSDGRQIAIAVNLANKSKMHIWQAF